ncbi:MAG: efflux RND transporter periplasmic adaptor subunit [Bacteroidetes bacterium]|nr:efflux RND transporter periplasmic adaptor subunit [Bacteroidota bacterium]
MTVRILYFIVSLFLISCNSRQEKENPDVYYTCSMDPQVRENKPGTCPICKMPLTAVKKSQDEDNDQLHLSDQQVRLGHILVDTVKKHVFGSELFLTGTLVANQNKTVVISSRVMGRIEKLYFKNTGEDIHKGEPIYDIYSEEINLALKELKLAIEKKKTQINITIDIDRMISSARNKLVLFGLSESQINELEEAGNFTQLITIKSPDDGVITSIDITEGNYVMEGGSVLHLADYSSLWAEAQVFSEDMAKIKESMAARVFFPNNSKLNIEGKVIFTNPELNTTSKINLIRIEIVNEKNVLKPGMQINASVLYDEFATIALPTDAIILEEKGATVWLKTEKNKYKSVMVHTGIESNGYTQVLHGIEMGDIAVVSGNYLLQSEYTFKKGSSVMQGHQH